MRLFVDLDGVLVNIHRTACELFLVPYPQKSILYFDWLFKQTNLTIEEFLDKMDSTPGFWENLQPFAWTPELINILDRRCENWQILTAATQDSRSWKGKKEWVSQYFRERGAHKLIMLHGDKSRLASRDAVLLDDHRLWCKNWDNKQGRSFHWIEYTDDHEDMWRAQLARLDEFLAKASEELK